MTADAAPAGQVFWHWTVEPSDADLGEDFEAYSASTTVTMPDHDVTLTAEWEVAVSTSPVYRFWSSLFRGHFFTIHETERDNLVANHSHVWTAEGTAWHAYASPTSESSPVYRFWSPVHRRHFYTISLAERNNIQENSPHIWTYEGVAWHAYTTAGPGRSPIYRFWSPVNRGHFFTISQPERDHIIATWPDVWTYEGIAYYAYPAPKQMLPVSLAMSETGDAGDATSVVEAADGPVALRDRLVSTVAHADALVTVTNEVGTYYPLSIEDRYVAAMVYDPPEDAWRRVQSPVFAPEGLWLPVTPLGQPAWLAVLTDATGNGDWRLAHANWFGRLDTKPDRVMDLVADDTQTGVDLPVETYVVPESDGPVTLLVFCPQEDRTIDTATGLSVGDTYDVHVPAWNRWYRIDFVEETSGRVITSQWVGHERTHVSE